MKRKSSGVVKALAFAFLCIAVQYGNAQQVRTILTPACPTSPPVDGAPKAIPPLLAIIIPELISLGVDVAATALNEAASTKSVSRSSDSEAFNFYSIDSSGELRQSDALGCIVVVAGGEDEHTESDPQWLQTARKHNALKWMRSTPDFYLEVALRPHQDNLGLILLPRLIFSKKPFEEPGFWRRDERGYVVAISLKDESTLSSFGAATFTFKEVKPGTALSRDGFAKTERASEWPLPVTVGPLPENSDITAAVAKQKSASAPYRETNALLKAALKTPPIIKENVAYNRAYLDALSKVCREIVSANLTKPKNPIQDERCPIDLFIARRDLAKVEETENLSISRAWADAYFKRECLEKNRVEAITVESKDVQICKLPAPSISEIGLSSVSVALVETTEATKFVKSLAAAFDRKKGDVKTALNDRLNPARRDELEENDAAKKKDARQQYQLSLLKVQQLDAQLREAFDKQESARIAIQIQLVQAKIDANKAALKAGEVAPYPEYE